MDFVDGTTSVPVLEESVVTICAMLVVADDSLLEHNEQLQLLVSAGGLQYSANITILDTVDSECYALDHITSILHHVALAMQLILLPIANYQLSLLQSAIR